MKERLLFQSVEKKRRERALCLIREADVSGIKILKDAAKQLRLWRPFILIFQVFVQVQRLRHYSFR